MQLNGLHILLTYQCNLECDHCFVWGSSRQSGTLTLKSLRLILQQAKEQESLEWIYYEGGEPFLFYPLLLRGVKEAVELGFKVGLVTNAYWATNREDAIEWLSPFKGLIQDFSISSDLFHWSEKLSSQAKDAGAAAEELGIPVGVISIAQPETESAGSTVGQLPPGESKVMFRGRAAEKLSSKVNGKPWSDFRECPCEDLREPGRVHLDPLGNVHICQGIVLGNVFETSLKEICQKYNPDRHPIIGPLLQGGPAELCQRYSISHKDSYADACHFCYLTRLALRERFPRILRPDQMYGVAESS
jgi:MoaA/NifB/PqqE/SkfB family radical SAM enzyme